MIFDSGNFWNLDKSYYSEDLNAGGGKYNTYEEFASGIRNDANLSQFEFSQPFNYIPSYGSSVKIQMNRSVVEYGDGYLSINPMLMNNYSIAMDLSFNNRSDKEASEIINYIKGTGSHAEFAFQVNERSQLDTQEAYRSIYSMPPYFVQEFTCKSINTRQDYPDNNSIKTIFLNNNVSDFTAHNILEIPSMPERLRTIISGARGSREFNEKPSFVLQKEIAMRSSSFSSSTSRPCYSEDGINDSVYVLDLRFENIDDEKLLKILSFIIEKKGTESFDYELTSPHSGKRSFVCGGAEHIYKFKGVHDLSCKFMEVF